MRYPTTLDDLRRRRLVVAGMAAALLMIAFLTYAVLVNRAHSSRPAPTETNKGAAMLIPAEATPLVTELPGLSTIADPETFAHQVAEAIFAWDTATLLTRTDHIEQLIAIADPTGDSTPGLVSDLDNYLPTRDAWVELTSYDTRQWLSIHSVTTPTKWADAQAEAGDELLPGTTAFTIHGTRHRSGVWDGDPVTSEHDVSFTVFIVCGPTYSECHLLRLSMLDKPLD